MSELLVLNGFPQAVEMGDDLFRAALGNFEIDPDLVLESYIAFSVEGASLGIAHAGQEGPEFLVVHVPAQDVEAAFGIDFAEARIDSLAQAQRDQTWVSELFETTASSLGQKMATTVPVCVVQF